MHNALTTANVISARLKLETFKPLSFAACKTAYNLKSYKMAAWLAIGSSNGLAALSSSRTKSRSVWKIEASTSTLSSLSCWSTFLSEHVGKASRDRHLDAGITLLKDFRLHLPRCGRPPPTYNTSCSCAWAGTAVATSSPDRPSAAATRRSVGKSMTIFPATISYMIDHAHHEKGQQGGTACGCLMGGLRRRKCSSHYLHLGQ
jgi:hypothetical protein